jgi:hypothetical protein
MAITPSLVPFIAPLQRPTRLTLQTTQANAVCQQLQRIDAGPG